MRSILVALLLVLLGCGSMASARRVVQSTAVRVKVQVRPTKASGRPWDAAGGAPDIYLCVDKVGGQQCTPMRCGDRLSCRFPRVRVPVVEDRVFLLHLVDQDLHVDDPIGTATCTLNRRGGVSCTHPRSIRSLQVDVVKNAR